MKPSYDVVIVGGGIAGSSLATVLARQGIGVLVLERTTGFVDRVRGEALMPWGAVEAKRTGIYDILRSAGGVETPVWMQYDEGLDGGFPIPVGSLLEGGHAPLGLGHPQACQALIEAAGCAGADVVRGVDGVDLLDGSRGVRYTSGGEAQEVSARLVVGADGRRSAVRDQAGIVVEHQEAPSMITGLLIEPATPLPDHDVLAVEGDIALLSFMQPEGRTRLYVLLLPDQRDRYTGKEGAKKLLASVRLNCIPIADALADGTPAGPCATYPGDDTWTASPYADGVVLIGDAAGYNNPIIGQGLSLSMRDVRMVSDALKANADWSSSIFEEYGEERLERMRRVRLTANLASKAFIGFPSDPDGRMAFTARRTTDPTLLQGFLTVFTGPDAAPAEAFDEARVAELLEAS